MKRLLTVLIFAWIAFSGYSQMDTLSVMERIERADFSKSDIISRSRRLLINDFKDGNKMEVERTLRYLQMEIDDEYTHSLWDSERLLLDFWLGNYSNLILVFSIAKPQKSSQDPDVVYPKDEVLYKTLVAILKERDYEEIINDYKSMHFTADANDFLYLLWNRLLDKLPIDEINDLSDLFIQSYPNSPLIPAVKKTISYKMVPSDFSFEWDFGGGGHFASGAITDWLTQGAGIFMDINFNYRQCRFGLAIVSSFGTVKRDIPLPNRYEWPASKFIEVDKFSLSLGYRVLQGKKIILTPYGGISFNSASFNTNYNDYDYDYWKNVRLATSISPVVGCDLDFTLASIKSGYYPYFYYYPYYNPNMRMDMLLGLKAAFYPNLITTQGDALKGNTFFIGLSLKCKFYTVQRAYQ
jgi:hypothetical protein